MIRLAILFIGLPVLELALLIEVGSRIGTLATVAIIVLTGVLGAYLARRQGLGVMRQLQSELDRGRVPMDQIADGVMILLAAAVLVTPGILTDIFGFLCLIPASRNAIRKFLWARFQRAVSRGRVTVVVDTTASASPGSAGDRGDSSAPSAAEEPVRRLPESPDSEER